MKTLNDIKAHSQKLMNEYKAEIAGKTGEDFILDSLINGDIKTKKQAMINLFRSFDTEFNASNVLPSKFYEPRGFSKEYKELAFK